MCDNLHSETKQRDEMLNQLRRKRDDAARIGDHAEALILNDRIKDLKDGHTSPMVERVMHRFESALARRRAYGPPQKH